MNKIAIASAAKREHEEAKEVEISKAANAYLDAIDVLVRHKAVYTLNDCHHHLHLALRRVEGLK